MIRLLQMKMIIRIGIAGRMMMPTTVSLGMRIKKAVTLDGRSLQQLEVGSLFLRICKLLAINELTLRYKMITRGFKRTPNEQLVGLTFAKALTQVLNIYYMVYT